MDDQRSRIGDELERIVKTESRSLYARLNQVHIALGGLELLVAVSSATLLYLYLFPRLLHQARPLKRLDTYHQATKESWWLVPKDYIRINKK